MERDKNKTIDTKHIDVLDGIRALCVIIVLVFHFWQQTWISPHINTPFLSWLGISHISFDNFARVGYLFVDALILLSSFLLFLPIARQILMGNEIVPWKQFIKKRIARILPSYLLCIFILFILELARGSYPNFSTAIHDFISHLTFTQTFHTSTYIGTKLNVVLWTIAVEVWFYILFPFIAMFIKRKKGKDNINFIFIRVFITYFIMNLIAYLYIYKFTLNGDPGKFPMRINQLPAFMGVYSNGMVGALIFVAIAKNFKHSILFDIINTIITIVSLLCIVKLVNSCATCPDIVTIQRWQVTKRFILSLAFLCFFLSSAFSIKLVRWLLSNKIMKFLSGISFNLYIWHQWLSVQMKYEWHIPAWVGTTPPNQYGDTIWMWKYAIIITIVAFIVATITTYFIEKPMSNIIMGKSAFKKNILKRHNKSI